MVKITWVFISHSWFCGSDFQPEGVWITTVWDFESRLWFTTAVHYTSYIPSAYSNLHHFLVSLSLPSHYIFLPCLFTLSAFQWAVDVAVRCFAVWCSGLVESNGCSRNGNKHELLWMRNLKLKLSSHVSRLLRPYLWPSSTSLCIYFIYAFIVYHCQTTLPHFFCLVLIPWCYSKWPPAGFSLSPRCFLLASP